MVTYSLYNGHGYLKTIFLIYRNKVPFTINTLFIHVRHAIRGKAAVAMCGITELSSFKITISRRIELSVLARHSF